MLKQISPTLSFQMHFFGQLFPTKNSSLNQTDTATSIKGEVTAFLYAFTTDFPLKHASLSTPSPGKHHNTTVDHMQT